jgi:hypothetical protein
LFVFNDFSLPVTIDASDLLFTCQREDPVRQLPFQGLFWLSLTRVSKVRKYDVAKLACAFHIGDLCQFYIASDN